MAGTKLPHTWAFDHLNVDQERMSSLVSTQDRSGYKCMRFQTIKYYCGRWLKADLLFEGAPMERKAFYGYQPSRWMGHPVEIKLKWVFSGFLTIIRSRDYSYCKFPWSYSRPSSYTDSVTPVLVKVHNSVICSFQPQIFMCFNFLRMVSNTIIPRNSVANQNTVDFTVWNGMVPLYVECGGACVVVSDNFWTNRGNCEL